LLAAQPLESVATSCKIEDLADHPLGPVRSDSDVRDGLPGWTNATIRSRAVAEPDRLVLPGTPSSQTKALIWRLYYFATCENSGFPGRVGRGKTDLFAPFVYRLGRHPFTVERAVRFR
jgi:hypothetical protein